MALNDLEPHYRMLRPESLQPVERAPLHIVLDNIRSAYNTGSMFRTADAAAAEHVHLCGMTAYPPNAKLAKTAVNLKLIPCVSGKPRIAELVAFNMIDITVKGFWRGRARLHLVPHVNAPVADLPEEASAEDVSSAGAMDVAEDEVAPEVGTALFEQGDHAEDAGVLTAAQVTLPEDVEALEKLSVETVEQGEPDEAIAQYQQALEGYQADGNVQDELAAIEALAKLNLNTERYDDVLAYLDRGMTLAQEADNPQREGEMLCILGDLQHDLGRLDGAEMAYREAISALRPVEAWLDIGLTLEKLGRIYMKQRRVDEAIGVWQQSLPIFENEGRWDLLRRVLNLLGDVNMRQMNWSQSEAYYTRALETAQALEEDRPQFVQLSKLANLMETSGRRDMAITFYRRALYFALRLAEPEPVSYTHLTLPTKRIV